MTKFRDREITASRLQSTYFAFEGRVNMVDPSLSLEPGELVAANNFEIDKQIKIFKEEMKKSNNKKQS